MVGQSQNTDLSSAPAISRRICFGYFEDWIEAIRAGLAANYSADFRDLAEVDPQEYDAIFPLRTDQYPALALWPMLNGKKFFVPNSAAEKICDDKLALCKYLAANGFSAFIPALRSPGPPYPYIWKGKFGAWGQHCHIIGGPDDEHGINLSDPDYFAQTLTPGEIEYATHILRADNRVRYVSTMEYRMAKPISVRGEQESPLERRFVRQSPYHDLFVQILGRLGYNGTACFNYKIANGRPLIFEINPRFGGSLTQDITAYADAYIAALSPD